VIRSRGRVRATGRVQATLQPGIVVIDDEVHVDPVVAGVDESIILRVAAEAAHAQYPISRRGLMALSALNIEPGAVWHDRTRQALLSLLGAGSYLVHTIEALEQYELFSVMVPEWRFVRSLPQRNAFHTYTVDRHLLQTVVNAVEFVRSVRRPDLLLMSALLHDLGKGRPEDHTAVGIEIAERVAPRIGFAPDDVAVLSTLVRHHLLLAETATRRDISDARTITTVVEAVGDQQTLDLLRTLTEADSRATGPSAWTPWKARLIGELVAAVAADLAGRPRHSTDDSPEIVYLDAIERVTALGGLHIHREDAGDFDRWIIATSDRPGLFATIAGAFVVSGCQVVSADAWTSSQSVVLDRFLVARSDHTATDHRRVEANVRGVVDGTIDLHARIEQRIRTYDRSHRRAHAAVPARLEVIISNDASDTTTMIDVRAPDGVAVLYRLATRVSELGLEIRSAKVATLGHEVVDVFYVQQRGGDASKVPVSDHERLRVALQRSLTDPVEDQSRAVSGSVEVPQSRK
jgi:[protein-PII] uridylyltransferase